MVYLTARSMISLILCVILHHMIVDFAPHPPEATVEGTPSFDAGSPPLARVTPFPTNKTFLDIHILKRGVAPHSIARSRIANFNRTKAEDRKIPAETEQKKKENRKRPSDVRRGLIEDVVFMCTASGSLA